MLLQTIIENKGNGKGRTAAKCLPLYPSDERKGIIRIDGLIRNNAGVAIGDSTLVRKIKAVPAEKVIVAPLEAIPPIDERYLADPLESVPLIKGDNVIVLYFGGRLMFQVIGVTPSSDALLVFSLNCYFIGSICGILMSSSFTNNLYSHETTFRFISVIVVISVNVLGVYLHTNMQIRYGV